jgi:hypothetical protein
MANQREVHEILDLLQSFHVVRLIVPLRAILLPELVEVNNFLPAVDLSSNS